MGMSMRLFFFTSLSYDTTKTAHAVYKRNELNTLAASKIGDETE